MISVEQFAAKRHAYTCDRPVMRPATRSELDCTSSSRCRSCGATIVVTDNEIYNTDNNEDGP